MILFDPGLPQSRAFICKVVQDIVSRYDVDAIHMDDYFYPYPVAGLPFPDDASFETYGLSKGYKNSQRNDWRRENVNLLVKDIKAPSSGLNLGSGSVSVRLVFTATRKIRPMAQVATRMVCRTTMIFMQTLLCG
jgi:hypothetical protein